MFNVKQNYGIFTQIGVLQRFNGKEAKAARKAAKMAKTGSAKCCDNFSIIAKKLQAIGIMSVATIGALL